MEFLDLLETVRAEEASVQRLFAGDGQAVAATRGSRRRSPKYMRQLAEAARFVEELYTGRRPLHQFQEAMSTSDFPLLFGDILDRQLLAGYQEASYSWNRYARRRTVRDFRQVKRYTIDGAEGTLPEVEQNGEYKESSLSEGEYAYSVKKYGRRLPLTWEALVNDDLDAFRDIPDRFGKAARRSEEKFVTELFVGASGPKSSTFTAISGNPALSISALQDAMSVILTQVDADGEPIMVGAMTLVTPPQLQVVANNIINALQIEAYTSGGGTSAQHVFVRNWLGEAGIVAATTNFYVPIVASTANGATSWWLIADPNQGRPAMEVGFLTGYETPQIFRKASNAIAVGSGAMADPMAGDFDNDAVNYKVRHVFGGTIMDTKMIVASNGSGS